MATTAARAFTGFSPEALKFLRGLAKNNAREWFVPRKETYETECLEPLKALANDATEAMCKAKIPLGAGPKGGTFRIYRDIRFSADKSPYKTNLGAYLAHQGQDDSPGGLYVHIQPKQSFMACGFYQIDNTLLLRWRESMATDPKHFQKTLDALARNGLTISEQGDALKRMPRGFESQAESPNAKYFRMKSFMTAEDLSDEDVSGAGLIERIVSLAKRSKPLFEYGWSIADER